MFTPLLINHIGGLPLFVYLALNLILPHLIQNPETQEVTELTWVDVDLTEDSTSTISETPPVEVSSETEFAISTFEFPPIVIPDTPNDPIYVKESTQELPTPIRERSQLSPREPVLTKEESKVIRELEKDLEAEVVISWAYTKTACWVVISGKRLLFLPC